MAKDHANFAKIGQLDGLFTGLCHVVSNLFVFEMLSKSKWKTNAIYFYIYSSVNKCRGTRMLVQK